MSWFLEIFDRKFFKSLNRVRDDRYFLIETIVLSVVHLSDAIFVFLLCVFIHKNLKEKTRSCLHPSLCLVQIDFHTIRY